MVYSPGRQVAVSKPGAELGAIVPTQHAISGLEVAGQQVCVPKVILEPC